MKLRFILLPLALATALTAFLHWRAHIHALELQSRFASQATRLAAESGRRDQLRDSLKGKQTEYDHNNPLLRLRAEVSELRRTSADEDALKAGLEKLQQEIQSITNRPPDPGPDPSQVRNYWPRDQLVFTGYADQTSAIQ